MSEVFNPPSLLSLTNHTVRVYWNLHKKKFSVQAHYGSGSWRVVAHAEELMLKDVTFKVSEAGRQRVLRTGVKNVHAYVVGGLIPFVNPDKGRRVSYDPKVFDCFVMPHSMAFYAVEKLPLVTLVSIDRKPAVFGPSGEYEVNDNGFLVKTEEK
jgi:hypothetical protein